MELPADREYAIPRTPEDNEQVHYHYVATPQLQLQRQVHVLIVTTIVVVFVHWVACMGGEEGSLYGQSMTIISCRRNSVLCIKTKTSSYKHIGQSIGSSS